MNAIKGFTSLVLRRSGDTLPDRHRENLKKVTQASDHLLAMINDILDLSKIEAGQMDVNPEPFDMKALVTYWVRKPGVFDDTCRSAWNAHPSCDILAGYAGPARYARHAASRLG